MGKGSTNHTSSNLRTFPLYKTLLQNKKESHILGGYSWKTYFYETFILKIYKEFSRILKCLQQLDIER